MPRKLCDLSEGERRFNSLAIFASGLAEVADRASTIIDVGQKVAGGHGVSVTDGLSLLAGNGTGRVARAAGKTLDVMDGAQLAGDVLENGLTPENAVGMAGRMPGRNGASKRNTNEPPPATKATNATQPTTPNNARLDKGDLGAEANRRNKECPNGQCGTDSCFIAGTPVVASVREERQYSTFALVGLGVTLAGALFTPMVIYAAEDRRRKREREAEVDDLLSSLDWTDPEPREPELSFDDDEVVADLSLLSSDSGSPQLVAAITAPPTPQVAIPEPRTQVETPAAPARLWTATALFMATWLLCAGLFAFQLATPATTRTIKTAAIETLAVETLAVGQPLPHVAIFPVPGEPSMNCRSVDAGGVSNVADGHATLGCRDYAFPNLYRRITAVNIHAGNSCLPTQLTSVAWYSRSFAGSHISTVI